MFTYGGPCLDKSTTNVAPLRFRKTIFFSRLLSKFVNWHISQGVSIMVVDFLRAHTLLIGDNCDFRPFEWREMFSCNRCVNNVRRTNKVLWYFTWVVFFVWMSLCLRTYVCWWSWWLSISSHTSHVTLVSSLTNGLATCHNFCGSKNLMSCYTFPLAALILLSVRIHDKSYV